MARPVGSSNKRTREFVTLYETLVTETGINPVEVLFRLCKNKSPMIRRAAAADLLPYRYPKQAAEQAEIEAQSEFLFIWEDVETADVPDDVSH